MLLVNRSSWEHIWLIGVVGFAFGSSEKLGTHLINWSCWELIWLIGVVGHAFG